MPSLCWLVFLRMSGREREDFAKDPHEDSEIEEDHMVSESAAWSDDEVSGKEIPSLSYESQIEIESSDKSKKYKDSEHFDRRKFFVIEDTTGSPHCCYHAAKSFSFTSELHSSVMKK